MRIFTETSYSFYNLIILVPYGTLYKNKIYNIITTIAGTVVGISMYVIQMLEKDYYSEEKRDRKWAFLLPLHHNPSAGLQCCNTFFSAHF